MVVKLQEEVEQKTFNIVVSTTKLTARTILNAGRTALQQYQSKLLADKSSGKQSVRMLLRQNRGVSSVEIDKTNIKGFERYAKKYGIDYAIRKDSSEVPPRYLVFFKAPDVEAFNAAFKEYSASLLSKNQASLRAGKAARTGAGRSGTSRQSPAQAGGTRLMTTKKLTKLIALYLPYILLGLVATNLGEAWRLAEGKELGDKIMAMMGTFPVAFVNPLPSLHPLDLLIGFSCGAGLRLAVYLRSKNAKRSTDTAWSTALPGGAMPRTSSRSWLPNFPTISF